jgi:hypothetical protein
VTVLGRFTRPARIAVTAAVEEAERRRDGHIGTEHLMLGLARSDAPVLAATLREAGVDPAAVRAGRPVEVAVWAGRLVDLVRVRGWRVHARNLRRPRERDNGGIR